MDHDSVLDPVRLELIRYSLDAIADEMAVALVRTASSINVKATMDMCCALCDADGRLIVQGLTLPTHLGSIPAAMAAVRRKYGDDLRQGDVVILNDPYDGGSHLPDIFAFKPIFHRGEHIAWAVSEAHHLDIGGMTAGGNGCEATEIYQEGLRIPPLKLYDAGRQSDVLVTLIRTNVRVPGHVLGDIRAQVAACATGERALLKLVDRYGLDEVRRYSEALLDLSERYARAAIAAMPDGAYQFTDHLDSDGLDPAPVGITVTITVTGERLAVDFTGTAPQVRGAINCTLSFARSAVYATFRNVVGGNPPNNEGFFRPITVHAPLGTLVNPRPPAAVAARGLTGFRMANTLFGAWAKIAPAVVYACEVGGDSGISFSGVDDAGKPFVLLEFVSGSWGGRPTKDGIDGFSSAVVNFSNNPVEMIEAEYPLTIECYGYVADTCGAGRFRGGLALARQYRLDAARGQLQIRTDRTVFPPFGLQGGGTGALTTNLLIQRGVGRRLTDKCTVPIERGDVFRHVLAGAGGWGDPAARSAAAIIDDLLDEKITPAFARAAFGFEAPPDGRQPPR
jgi:N-methylhydantoinase B